MTKSRGVRGAAGGCAVASLVYLLVRGLLTLLVSALMGLAHPGASLAKPLGFSGVSTALFQLLIGLGAIVLTLFFLLKVTRLKTKDLRIMLPAPWSPGFCLPVFLGVANLANLAGALINRLTGSPATSEMLPSGGPELLMQFLALCVMPAIAEELLFRGAFQGLMRPCGSAAAIFAPALLNESAGMAGIAIAHSAFNILCTAMLLPCGGLLEKLAVRLVPNKAQAEETVELDERLLATPSLALQRCRAVACDMAAQATLALQNALRSLEHYTPELAASIREDESRCDHYEDVLGTYLVKLSARKMGDDESEEAAELLKAIGDFERISDHAVNVIESAEEVKDKGLHFSDRAKKEIEVLCRAIDEIVTLTAKAFISGDMQAAAQVEPLEQVVDHLRDEIKDHHVIRLQNSECTIELGFVLSDILTNLERVSDHCSNIAGCVIDA
ncbi:MAG TPA: hypothetical protein DDW15_08545, partial [Subdoligranulum sp.]|nr:hypothetical protein [Subdoligranulum sp.]